MITGLSYWYDQQMRRYLEQVVRAFSGFQYQTGQRNGQPGTLVMVPCRMASKDRMVATIMRNGSENTLLAVPLITVAQTGLTGRRADVQNLTHVDTLQVVERAVDPNTGAYTGAVGNKYTVERLMPRPFQMNVQVDIWTSNMDQKHQLMEQILTVIYPVFEIQNSDSALDWSAKTMCTVEDINWTSRSVNIGSTDEIEISTLTLSIPMWLSPPAKVTQQRRIEQIVANMGQSTDPSGDVAGVEGSVISQIGSPTAQVVVTPGDFGVSVSGGVIRLLGAHGATVDAQGNPYRWADLFTQYGTLRPSVSELHLKLVADVESTSELVGTIQIDSNHPGNLLWQVDVDTLPANTLSPVDAIIDPHKNFPGMGLPTAATGQRYLLVDDIGQNTGAWGALNASANDIIQYQSGHWVVSFDASTIQATEYVTNVNTGRQLRWSNQGWVMAIDGDYPAGLWRLQL